MKQWLAVMIILVIEWADVGTSTEVQVEQKDGISIYAGTFVQNISHSNTFLLGRYEYFENRGRP